MTPLLSPSDVSDEVGGCVPLPPPSANVGAINEEFVVGDIVGAIVIGGWW